MTNNPTIVFSVCRDISTRGAVAGLPSGFVELCDSDDDAGIGPAYLIGNPNDIVVTKSKSGKVSTTVASSGTDEDVCQSLGSPVSTEVENAQNAEKLRYVSPSSSSEAEEAEKEVELDMTIGLIDEDDPAQGVVLYYKHGDMCTEDKGTWPGGDDTSGDKNTQASLEVKFICYPGVNNHIPYATKAGRCAYEVCAAFSPCAHSSHTTESLPLCIISGVDGIALWLR